MAPATTQPAKRHRVVVWVLIGLATLIAFVSTLTLWVERQLLDNHAWSNASEQVLQDKGVQQALSVYLVNQLYQNVDVAAALQERLPPNLDPLAAPAAQALREPAARAVSFMIARPRVQALWVNANALLHQKLVNVLENKTGEGISTGNGVVTLHLRDLLISLAQEIGLSGKRIAALPPGAGDITVLKSSQLGAAQDAVQVTRALSRWLLVLVIALYVAAAFVAKGYRRVTVRSIGFALIGVGLAVLVTRKLVGNYVIDAITSQQYHGTGHRIWLIETSILGDIGWAAVFYGVALVAAMLLAGGTSVARSIRRQLAPYLIDEPVLTWGTAAGLVLLLVLWGGTHALRTWWGVALAAALIAIGVVALRRQVLAERAAAVELGPPASAKELALT